MRGTPTIFRGDLLIDGYNLLHAAGLARRNYGPGEFEKTRLRLLKLLAGQLFDRERRRTTVVFDAPRASLGPSPPKIVHGIRVIFAGGDGDADALIERLIQSSTAPRRLHVISSDHRIQSAARRRRSKSFDSDRFLERIVRRRGPEERARDAEPPQKQHGLTTPGEIDVWLKAFGDVASVPREPAPPLRKPQSRSPAPAPADSTDPSGSPADLPPVDQTPPPNRTELSFWEQRIAELWEQTDTDES